MRRFLATAALGIGVLATVAPVAPANACEFSQCAWGKVVCSVTSCPIFCTRNPVNGRTICIAR
jgi:Zn-finger protein